MLVSAIVFLACGGLGVWQCDGISGWVGSVRLSCVHARHHLPRQPGSDHATSQQGPVLGSGNSNEQGAFNRTDSSPRSYEPFGEIIAVFFPPQLVSYEGTLEVYLKELKDLTVRVVLMESSPDDYIKLDFELLRIELREFEALVSQLKHSLNSSSPLFDSLYTEVTPTSQ